jgi:hypothetical protein
MMRDIRRHGQDVILTLTMDPGIADAQIEQIAKDLQPFGRMQLRINHEATGTWFTFNKRYSYEEVAAFFVHATELIHSIAPQIQTILCIGGVEDPDPLTDEPAKTAQDAIVMEDIFADAVTKCDIWSVDKYMALHWGWPCDVADATTNTYKRASVARTYELTKMSYERFKRLNNGVSKPMVMSEFNADGDVVGPYEQISMMQEFFRLREEDSEDWLNAITFYQFRDRGRLGLEIEDPNNAGVGVEQPILKEYRKLLHSPLCRAQITRTGDAEPLALRWGGSEDATGVAVCVPIASAPVFLELTFDDALAAYNLMILCEVTDEAGQLCADRWFYKGVATSFVDLMPLFFETAQAVPENAQLTLTFFAPPADGVNEPAQGADWAVNYYQTLPSLPTLRMEYEPVLHAPSGWKDARNTSVTQ